MDYKCFKTKKQALEYTEKFLEKHKTFEIKYLSNRNPKTKHPNVWYLVGNGVYFQFTPPFFKNEYPDGYRYTCYARADFQSNSREAAIMETNHFLNNGWKLVYGDPTNDDEWLISLDDEIHYKFRHRGDVHDYYYGDITDF